MNRKQYFELKRYIRTLCMDSVIDLATNVGLNSYETTILLHLNKNDTRIHTSLDLGVCVNQKSREILEKSF